MTNLKIGFLVLCVIAVASAAPADSSKKSCSEDLIRKADEAFSELVIYNGNQILWPNNESELKSLCAYVSKATKTFCQKDLLSKFLT